MIVLQIVGAFFLVNELGSSPPGYEVPLLRTPRSGLDAPRSQRHRQPLACLLLESYA